MNQAEEKYKKEEAKEQASLRRWMLIAALGLVIAFYGVRYGIFTQGSTVDRSTLGHSGQVATSCLNFLGRQPL